MPRGSVPSTYMDILECATLGHFATLDAAGRPQVNPVWFLWNGEHLLIGVLNGVKKLENVRRDPHVALSIADPANPYRYLEVRGEVVDIEQNRDLTFFNEITRHYTGGDASGDPGWKLTIRIDSWTAVG